MIYHRERGETRRRIRGKRARALPKLFSFFHSSGPNFVFLKRSFIGLSAFFTMSNLPYSHVVNFRRKFNLQVVDGTFMEEPGSGAVATIENKKVSVGTVDWVQRYVSLGFLLFW